MTPDEMAEAGLRWVRKTASLIARDGLPPAVTLDDLHSAGHEALAEAIRTWRPDGGRGFQGYVIEGARRAMLALIRDARRYRRVVALSLDHPYGDDNPRAWPDPRTKDTDVLQTLVSEEAQAARVRMIRAAAPPDPEVTPMPPPDALTTRETAAGPVRLKGLPPPEPDAVAALARQAGETLYARLAEHDAFGEAVKSLVGMARDKNLDAVKVIVGFAIPPAPTTAVQQLVIQRSEDDA